MKTQWKNRILGYGEEDPEQLLAHESNWRIHPTAQQEAMSGVLDQLGVIQSVIVNARTQKMLDGHMRASIAISRGQRSIPVTYVDLSPEEEALALMTFDPLGDLAVADAEIFSDLLASVPQLMPASVADLLLENIGNDNKGRKKKKPPKRENKQILCPHCRQSFVPPPQ